MKKTYLSLHQVSMHKTFNQKKHDTKENWMTKAEKYYKINMNNFVIFYLFSLIWSIFITVIFLSHSVIF